MTIRLPEPVGAYFAGSNAHAPEALAAAFAVDGVVRDEGHSHQGRVAIAAWAKASAARYNMLISPVGVTEAAEKVAVLASVAGDFPGSPIKLTFQFVLSEGGIRSLEIDGGTVPVV